jgi:hypothetical protein
MIIVLEPQCIGSAHDIVNASLLYSISKANKNEKLAFFADLSHINCIKKNLLDANIVLPNVDYFAVKIPKKNLLRLSRIFTYYRLINQLLRTAYDQKITNIIFLSIYSYNLLILKHLLKDSQFNRFQIKIIVHGVLEEIQNPNPSFILNQIKHFGYALNQKDNDYIQYIVLSPSILKNISETPKLLFKKFVAIDLPYIYDDTKLTTKSDERIVFATIGQGNPYYMKCVAKVLQIQTDQEEKYELRIIGQNCGSTNNFSPNYIKIISGVQFIIEWSAIKIILTRFFPTYCKVSSYLSDKVQVVNINCISKGRRLSRDEIKKNIKDVDYLLFFYDENSYKYTASGSFFDAISYRKPIIFIGNNFFDYYYSSYRIGYRVETLSEIIELIKLISINGINNADYECQLMEIEKFRREININRENKELSFTPFQ